VSLARLAQGFKRQLVRRWRRASVALVLMRDAPGAPLVLRAAHGLGPEGPDGAVQGLLDRATREGRGVLILDARQDPAVDEKPASWRSGLAAPGGAQLVLCLLAREPAGFGYADLAEVESLAAEMAAADSGPARPAAERTLLVAAFSLALALAVAVVGVAAGALRRTPPPPPRPSGNVTTLQTAPPEQVAYSFLRMMATREGAQAYQVLSVGLRKRMSQAEFQQRVTTFMSSQTHRWDLQFRTARLEEAGSRSARVAIEPRRDLRGTWRWQLVREEQGWKLDALEGGPLE
jgi:hypothetical protein